MTLRLPVTIGGQEVRNLIHVAEIAWRPIFSRTWSDMLLYWWAATLSIAEAWALDIVERWTHLQRLWNLPELFVSSRTWISTHAVKFLETIGVWRAPSLCFRASPLWRMVILSNLVHALCNWIVANSRHILFYRQSSWVSIIKPAFNRELNCIST